MQKFYCNSCENTFFQDASEGITCPACGSNSVMRLSEETSGHFWKSKTFIVSMIVMAVMVIILVILPSENKVIKSENIITVQTFPEKCTIVTVVMLDNALADPGRYEYSVDNGYHWHKQNIYYSEIKRDLNILVREKANPDKIMEYPNNPVKYEPVPRPKHAAVNELCDCQKLSIYLIEPDNASGSITIHASPSNCPKEYSINGEQGPFQPDSLFFNINQGVAYKIYVRSAKCKPVAFSQNPYTPLKKTVAVPSTGGGSSQGKYKKESEIEKAPLLPYSVESREELFESIKSCVNDPSVTGIITVSLVVEEDGSISGYKGSQNPDLNNKIYQCITKKGMWRSGTIDGNYVRTFVELKIPF